MPLPFAGGIEATPNATLLFSLAAAIIYACAPPTPPRLSRTAAKAGSVALLALLAFLQGGPWLLVAALALSAIGDAFLSREGEAAFLGGLASFLAAHLVYIALFLKTGSGLEAFRAAPWHLALALAMAGFALLMLRLLWPRVGALRMPVAAYVAAILAMGLAALTTPALALIGGAVLFMASDAVLATEKFLMAQDSPHRAWMHRAVWLLYYPAQAVITLGLLLA
ncbi:lysoplasmalogenase [Mesorhizobium sp. SP-1A]|uniref:lysoplasmalogenase n=1 Tax=Mesorhizobium sp. SP-1A TaxID=3077840 RepID=UPI0028F6FB44|nr:lysoplasmalogenase [Mesorhizobium sp. SP-1A]